MSQPVQNLRDCRQLDPLRQNRSVDHQNWQAQYPRRVQLGARATASGVFRHYQFRAMALHQGAIFGLGKRTAGHNHVGSLQRQSAGFVDQPHQVVMLGVCRELLKVHTSDGQEHTLRRASQSPHSCGNIGNMMPCIPGLRSPRLTRKCRQWDLRHMASRNRIPAHLSREGMRGIHHMSDLVLAEISRQPVNTSKSAYAHRQRLRTRGFDTSGIGICRRNPLFRNGFGQGIGLGRAAKNQEVWHV